MYFIITERWLILVFSVALSETSVSIQKDFFKTFGIPGLKTLNMVLTCNNSSKYLYVTVYNY